MSACTGYKTGQVRPSVHAKKGHVATCIGLLASACRFLPTESIDVRVVLADGCGVRRSADTVCDQLDIQKRAFTSVTPPRNFVPGTKNIAPGLDRFMNYGVCN